MRPLELKGLKFGDCTVIEKVSDNGTGRTRWKFRCGCGAESTAYGYQLKNGHSRSCGCLQPRLMSKLGKKRPYEFLFNILKSNAKTAGRECDLTYEDFLRFTQISECHYCKTGIVWNPHRSRSGNYNSAYYLDRKDNEFGYIKSNLVVCCPLCNSTKTNQYTYEEMCKLGKVICEIQQERVIHGRIRSK